MQQPYMLLLCWPQLAATAEHRQKSNMHGVNDHTDQRQTHSRQHCWTDNSTWVLQKACKPASCGWPPVPCTNVKPACQTKCCSHCKTNCRAPRDESWVLAPTAAAVMRNSRNSSSVRKAARCTTNSRKHRPPLSNWLTNQVLRNGKQHSWVDPLAPSYPTTSRS